MIDLPLLLAMEIVVAAAEPVPADPWQQSFTANCGENVLEIVQPMYPEDAKITVRFNGEDLSNAAELSEELGQRGAAYRLSFACSQTDQAIFLRWVRGYPEGDGGVTCHVGSASFSNGAAHYFSGEEASEDTFWYR